MSFNFARLWIVRLIVVSLLSLIDVGIFIRRTCRRLTIDFGTIPDVAMTIGWIFTTYVHCSLFPP